MGRTLSFTRSSSTTSSRGGIPAPASARHITEEDDGGSALSSAAATPRSSEVGSFYDPFKAAAAALQQQLVAAQAEKRELEGANEQLRAELQTARAAARDLHSRASVAEDSRGAASQVGAGTNMAFVAGRWGLEPCAHQGPRWPIPNSHAGPPPFPTDAAEPDAAGGSAGS